MMWKSHLAEQKKLLDDANKELAENENNEDAAIESKVEEVPDFE